MMILTRIHIPADPTAVGLANGAHRLIADETLRRRTGRDFGATVAELGEAEACNLVVSQHSDIAGALGLAFEVKLGHITLRLEDPNGETIDHWKCRRTPSYA